MYKCKQCNNPVLVLKGHEPIRSCKCDTTIVLDVTATCNGKGVLKQK